MSKKSDQNFWEVALSPDQDYIAIFILVLFATSLAGNFIHSLITSSETLNETENFVIVAIIILLLLFAGFVWDQRKRKLFPFHISEADSLKRSQAVIAIPSNPGTIGKIIRYHSGTIQHIWLVGDSSVDDNYKKCLDNFADHEIKIHRITVDSTSEITNIYLGYRKAYQKAIQANIPRDQIVVDITGGKKPMTIEAFLFALEQGLITSYVESNYEQIEDNDQIKRANEQFAVVQYNPIITASDTVFEVSKSDVQ